MLHKFSEGKPYNVIALCMTRFKSYDQVRLINELCKDCGQTGIKVIIFSSAKKRNGIISTLAALVIAVAAFSGYAVTQSGKVPEGAIGQADATTNIQIEGAFAFDISQILLAIGFAATAIAVLLIIRTIHKNRR